MFTLAARRPAGFPFAAPKVHFKTKLINPGMEPESGAICTTLLSEWSPGTTVRSTLVDYHDATGVGDP